MVTLILPLKPTYYYAFFALWYSRIKCTIVKLPPDRHFMRQTLDAHSSSHLPTAQGIEPCFCVWLHRELSFELAGHLMVQYSSAGA